MKKEEIRLGDKLIYRGEDAGDPNNGEIVLVGKTLSHEEVLAEGFPKDYKEKGYTYYKVAFSDLALVVVSNFNLYKE